MPNKHTLAADFQVAIKSSIIRATSDDVIIEELLALGLKGEHDVAALLSNLYLGNSCQIDNREVIFPNNTPEAFKWAQVAVATDENDADAVWQLGRFYTKGVGCEKNVRMGLSLMHQALYIKMKKSNKPNESEFERMRDWAVEIDDTARNEGLMAHFRAVLDQNKTVAQEIVMPLVKKADDTPQPV